MSRLDAIEETLARIEAINASSMNQMTAKQILNMNGADVVTKQLLKERFKALILLTHPDKLNDVEIPEDKKSAIITRAAQAFKKVKDAYTHLSELPEQASAARAETAAEHVAQHDFEIESRELTTAREILRSLNIRFSQADFDVIAQTTDQTVLVTSLSILRDLNLLTQTNFDAIVNHNNPPGLLGSIIALQRRSLLTPEIFDCVKKHSDALSDNTLEHIVNTLSHAQPDRDARYDSKKQINLFTEQNFRAVMSHPNSYFDVMWALTRLNNAFILTQENFDIAMRHPNLNQISTMLNLRENGFFVHNFVRLANTPDLAAPARITDVARGQAAIEQSSTSTDATSLGGASRALVNPAVSQEGAVAISNSEMLIDVALSLNRGVGGTQLVADYFEKIANHPRLADLCDVIKVFSTTYYHDSRAWPILSHTSMEIILREAEKDPQNFKQKMLEYAQEPLVKTRITFAELRECVGKYKNPTGLASLFHSPGPELDALRKLASTPCRDANSETVTFNQIYGAILNAKKNDNRDQKTPAEMRTSEKRADILLHGGHTDDKTGVSGVIRDIRERLSVKIPREALTAEASSAVVAYQAGQVAPTSRRM